MTTSITTINVNGIRAATKQRSEINPGFLSWLDASGADIVLMQEIRADTEQAEAALGPALDAGWHLSMTESVVKGHAGVGVLSRSAPQAVRVGFGSKEFDATGRYLEADFDVPDLGSLTAASLYLPKGAAEPTPSATEKETAKFAEKKRFLGEFGEYLAGAARRRRHVVVGGDWNIAPAELDIKNWKGNLKNPGFLPHEREWVGARLESGWSDVVRDLHPAVEGPYSWWSWRGKAFDNDSGWRIDYQLANRSLRRRAVKAFVDRADSYDRRWSDHAPVTVIYH
ncbi:exodeoxyribonuclease III [Gordonia oryzae]|uniref:Exodeoxyribonuclease III n=1 Tax=Gordonia oryzae TaxID=2487349 RepID=A0A3N4GWY2_9ACTN|nr:exodeoxyribonuclease III [Gordonia oryzae]RPA65206.1 exodeoxyribonuclease III [Gordonia oryzae]